MSRRRLAVVVLAAWGLIWAFAERAPVSVGGDEAGAVPWLTDLDAARAEARRTGKPIFAVFT